MKQLSGISNYLTKSCFGLLLFTVLLFSSCENFFNGSNVKDELDRIVTYANATSYRILVAYEKDSGILRKPITGELTLKATDTFDLKFEPNDDFTFVGWQASSVDLPSGAKISDYITFEDERSPETKATFHKALTNLVIMAVCPALPSVDFVLTGNNGKFSPPKDTYTCIQSHSYNLSFEPDNDWEFIYWKIYDSTTGTEIPNGQYIQIDNVYESTTTYSLAQVPLDPQLKLTIQPVIAERPQIISYSPILSRELTLKDTTIQVIFDKDINEDSIYYTEPELTALMAELEITSKDDPRLRKTQVGTQTKYYGYIKNDEYFYKSFSIKNNNNLSQSLNAYFGAPVFDTSRELSIPTITDKEHLFDNYTKILVTLEKDFFYDEPINQTKTKSVAMAGSKKWIYQVNNDTDTQAPEIDAFTFGTFAEAAESPFDNYNNIGVANFLPDDGSVNLSLSITDDKSEMSSSFSFILKRLVDENYNEVNEAEVKTVYSYDYVNYKEAIFNKTLDFSNLPDGIYRASFVFSDRSSNPLSYPENDKEFYFIKDTAAPAITTPRAQFELSNAEQITSSNKITLNFPASELSKDIKSFEITYVASDQTTGTADYEKSGDDIVKLTLTVDPQIKYYDYTISAVDNVGHRSRIITKRIGTKTLCQGFVEVFGKTVTGAVPNSQVFIEGRTVVIPDMYVCDHEVTQAEYAQFMTYSSSQNQPKDIYGIGDNNPVYYSSWYEAIIYCNLRSAAEGLNPAYYLIIGGQRVTDIDSWANHINTPSNTRLKKTNNKYCYTSNSSNDILNDPSTGIKYDETANGYRLPTDAEWEYIAREENTSNTTYSGSNDIDSIAWYKENSTKSQIIKTKTPNSLGIYDMGGNITEWCYDRYSETIRSNTPATGPEIGSDRVSRGGSWHGDEHYAQVYDRFGREPNAHFDFGFRVVRNAY